MKNVRVLDRLLKGKFPYHTTKTLKVSKLNIRGCADRRIYGY